MPTNSIAHLLAYANVQMAAEALLERFSHQTSAGLAAALQFGDKGDDFIWGDGTSNPARAGTDHNCVPASLHGNDVLVGQGGDDELYGGTEDDWLWGDDEDAPDTPASNHGSNYLDGGDGADDLVGQGRDDTSIDGAFYVPSAFERRRLVLFEFCGDDWLDGGAGTHGNEHDRSRPQFRRVHALNSPAWSVRA